MQMNLYTYDFLFNCSAKPFPILQKQLASAFKHKLIQKVKIQWVEISPEKSELFLKWYWGSRLNLHASIEKIDENSMLVQGNVTVPHLSIITGRLIPLCFISIFLMLIILANPFIGFPFGLVILVFSVSLYVYMTRYHQRKLVKNFKLAFIL